MIKRLGQPGDLRGIYACGFWDANAAYTGGEDGIVKFWDLRADCRKKAGFVNPVKGRITCVKTMSTPKMAMVIGSSDGLVRTVDFREARTYKEFVQDGVESLALSPDEDHACYAAATTRGEVLIRERRLDWRTTEDGNLDRVEIMDLNVLRGDRAVRGLHQGAFSPSGLQYWSPTATASLRSWDIVCQDATKNYVDHALPAPATGCLFVKDDLPTLRRQPRSGTQPGAVIAWCKNGTVNILI